MILRKIVNLINPDRLMAGYRRLQFNCGAKCGAGIRTTYRANLFTHDCPRSNITIGKNALIDGTIEVYKRGVLSVGNNFFLGRSRIYCAGRMSIGNYVLISDSVAIMDSDLHPTSALARRTIADDWAAGHFPDVYAADNVPETIIGDDVWIGYGAVILKGASIGQGSIVGAGSVVVNSVPEYCVVAGSPARIIKRLVDSE